MTDILLPPALDVASLRPRYIDNTGVSTGTYSGVTRTASLGGDKLAMSLTFTLQGGSSSTGRELRAMMQAFLARLRGKQNRFYFSDPSYVQRGSFATAELLANGTFSNGTTGWSGTGGNTITVSSRTLRSTLTSVGADQSVRAAATVSSVVNGNAYAARMMVNAGRGTMRYNLYAGWSAGAADINSSGIQTAAGLVTIANQYMSNAPVHISLLDAISGRSVAGFQEVSYASLARCALANGAGQTGSGLYIYGLPLSTSDILMTGDQVEVITSLGSELKILTAALNSNSSGEGHMLFEPPLRGTVANAAAVIIYKPMGRWILAGNAPEWNNAPGMLTSATLDFEEAVA